VVAIQRSDNDERPDSRRGNCRQPWLDMDRGEAKLPEQLINLHHFSSRR
jgi:hypothetical protein